MNRTMITMIPLAVLLAGCGQKAEEPTAAGEHHALAAQVEQAYGSTEVRHGGERIQALLPALELLRRGETEAALEGLELTLDAAIIKADQSMHTFPDADRGSAQRALRAANTYRQEYPRNEVLKMPDANVLDDHRESQRQKAASILSQIADKGTANKPAGR